MQDVAEERHPIPLHTSFPLGIFFSDLVAPIRKFPAREGNITPQAIGKLIRKTRKAQGLRQDELAAASGVGVRFLVELEGGKETAQIGKTPAVLSALGCTLAIKPPGEGS